MKRLLLALVLTATATSAAAVWTQTTNNDSFVAYADLATIRESESMVKMWMLIDFKKVTKTVQGTYLSQKMQWEHDCKEDRGRLLASSWFSGQMGSGNVVYANSDAGNWSPVEPGSIGETMWKIACGK